MNSEDYIEQFDRYSTGMMSGKERADFDIQLTENQEIMNAFNLYKISLDAIESDIESDLRNTLKSWEAEENQQSNKGGKVVSFRRRLMSYGAAASVALLIGFFALQFFSSQPSGEELFSSLYTVDTYSSLRGDDSGIEQLTAGAEAFKSGDFEKAISKYASIPSSDEANYLQGQYFAGHSAIAMKDYKKAAIFFKAAASNNSKFKEKAEWNFVLTKVRMYDYSDDFEAVLNQIAATPDHSFFNKAKELKEHLEL